MEDAPIMVGGRESCSTCMTGSESRRMIPEEKGSIFLLGSLGGGEYLVGDGDGDVTGESEKDLLLTVVFGVEGGEETGDRGDWGGGVASLDFSRDGSRRGGDLSGMEDEELGEV